MCNCVRCVIVVLLLVCMFVRWIVMFCSYNMVLCMNHDVWWLFMITTYSMYVSSSRCGKLSHMWFEFILFMLYRSCIIFMKYFIMFMFLHSCDDHVYSFVLDVNRNMIEYEYCLISCWYYYIDSSVNVSVLVLSYVFSSCNLVICMKDGCY